MINLKPDIFVVAESLLRDDIGSAEVYYLGFYCKDRVHTNKWFDGAGFPACQK